MTVIRKKPNILEEMIKAYGKQEEVPRQYEGYPAYMGKPDLPIIDPFLSPGLIASIAKAITMPLIGVAAKVAKPLGVAAIKVAKPLGVAAKVAKPLISKATRLHTIREIFGKSRFPNVKVGDAVSISKNIKGRVISIDKYDNRVVEYSVSAPIKRSTEADKLSEKIERIEERIEKATNADYPDDDLIEKLTNLKEKFEVLLSEYE